MSLYESLSRVLAPFASRLNGLLTGYDGTTYSSPAEAVRTQISDLHVLIGDIQGDAKISGSAVRYEGDLTATNMQGAVDELSGDVADVNGRLREQGEDILELQEGGYVADQQQIGQKINAWLDEHPEATTTVEDGSITEAKFTDALKLKTVNGYITPEMYGAKGDGVTDDYAVIQNMLDTCPEQSVCVFNGTYFISSGLLITRPVNIYVYGKINVDKDAEYCVRVHGLGPRRNTFRLNLGNNGGATETWTTKSVIGLDLWASMENTYDVQIDGFTTGIRLMAGNTESDIVDCTYNKVFIRRIYNCKNAIHLTGMTGTGSLAGGTVAQNTFIGGRIGVQGASVGWLGEEDTLDNSYWGVRSDLSHSRTNNNNSFICVSFEGFGAKEAPYENRCRLTLNMAMGIYLNCRAEGMTGFYPAQVSMNPTMVIGGYAMDNILNYTDGGGKYLLPRKTILGTYGSPIVIKCSSTNEWLRIVGANNNIVSKMEGNNVWFPTLSLLPNGTPYASGNADKAMKLKFNYTRNYTPVDMASSAENGDCLFSNACGHIVHKNANGSKVYDIQPIYTTVPDATTIHAGTMAFVNGKPQWYDGTQWVYADGTPVPTT